MTETKIFIAKIKKQKLLLHQLQHNVSADIPAGCHQSASGCTAPSAPWRCEPLG